MENLINNKRKTLLESYLFEIVDDNQSLNIQGGVKKEDDIDDIFNTDIVTESKWHKATSILDNLF